MQHGSYLHENNITFEGHTLHASHSPIDFLSRQTLCRIYAVENDVEDRLVFTMNLLCMTQKRLSFWLCLIHTIFH